MIVAQAFPPARAGYAGRVSRTRAVPGPASTRARRRIGTSGQREIIRDAAVLVFAERGIEAATVEDVLARAEVSRQTFYRCYRNKSELLDAVHLLATERLMAVTASMGDEQLLPEQALKRHVTLLFDHAASSGPIVCELEREAMRPDSAFRGHRERRHRFSELFLARWVHRRSQHWPSKALVRAVLLALEQLWLEVAQSSGKPLAARRANERAATELVEALTLHAAHAPASRRTAQKPEPGC